MRVCLVFSIFKLCPWVFMFLFFMSSFWHRISAYADHASTTVVVATLATLTSISLFIFFLDEWASMVGSMSHSYKSAAALFGGDAFSLWSHKLSMLLKENGLWSIASSTKPKPLSPQDVVETERLRSEKPMQLLYWILKIRL